MPSIQTFDDIETAKTAIQHALQSDGSAAQLNALSRIRLRLADDVIFRLDPFSAAYRERALAIYRQISGRSDYDPARDEKTDHYDASASRIPIPYRFRDSDLVGEFLACYGWILRALNVRDGASVLEYGSGEGQLILSLARMGCKAYAVDIEQRFLDDIDRQASAIGVEVNTLNGQFGDSVPGILFDRVIFFEAFHHCLDHFETLSRIRQTLACDGFICLAGEPIIRAGSPNKLCVPYAWGPRLDGESLRSISEFGWMELGYSEEYFIDLCMRAGFAVEFHPNPLFERGNVYIARPLRGCFPILSRALISTWEGKSGWHTAEATHRWTDGDAWLPLPRAIVRSARVTVVNFQPTTIEVIVSADQEERRLLMTTGQRSTINIDLPEGASSLLIRSPSFTPPDDTRKLGVAVEAIEFS